MLFCLFASLAQLTGKDLILRTSDGVQIVELHKLENGMLIRSVCSKYPLLHSPSGSLIEFQIYHWVEDGSGFNYTDATGKLWKIRKGGDNEDADWYYVGESRLNVVNESLNIKKLSSIKEGRYPGSGGLEKEWPMFNLKEYTNNFNLHLTERSKLYPIK